jgi:hypothetical protein
MPWGTEPSLVYALPFGIGANSPGCCVRAWCKSLRNKAGSCQKGVLVVGRKFDEV